MRTCIAIGLLVLSSACDRHSPPDLVKGLGVPTAAPASVSTPATTEVADPAAEPAKSAATPSGKPRPGRTAKTAKPATRAATGAPAARKDFVDVANDPCAGLDGSELDDCLGFEAEGLRADRNSTSDFAREQERRDRELLERDASEAADRARGGEVGDEPPAYYDEGEDAGGMLGPEPDFEMEPDPAYDDDYAPPGQDDPPPEDDEYYPPPGEDSGW